MAILTRVGVWYKAHLVARAASPRPAAAAGLLDRKALRSLAILVALVFSKNVYLASLTSFYTFYLIHKFGISVQNAQLHLFLFLGAVAAGTFIGGPVGDRIGRKRVIWVSILGVLPFTLLMPYASLRMTELLTVVIGLILASAFPAIVVFAQELAPGRVGTVSGFFFGFAFGAGAVGAALLGLLADATSIDVVYRVCAFLPALGLLTYFLPDLEPGRKPARA
jgi:FSR family fosmidomycin resistance protein-like MFS transporter